MKILRIVHGLTNNIMDVQVADNFNLGLWAKEVKADEGVCVGDFFVNRQWIQHACILSSEVASQVYTEGMVKQ